ncbi:MAG TPA: OmpA family protein [Blastocatellia bacterium]|nr:OmpA family protein [Blastocatellia bacterium]
MLSWNKIVPGAACAVFLCALACVAFGQAAGDVKRHTIAVTYLQDPVTVSFAGTTLRPQAKGEATVERWRKRNETEIDISIENLIPAYNFGADYTTFVLWAITPTGQVSNLGEFRLSGSSARLKAATPLQTFAMIITAEPHYLVRLPSKQVVLENLAPSSKKVRIQVSEVYFSGDSGRWYNNNAAPAMAERDFAKTPMELLQARRAVQIAKLADGERFAPSDYGSAVRTLEQAEEAFRRGLNVHEVGRISRDAISLAVRTRDVAEERAESAQRRLEIARRDEEVRRATENASNLESKLGDTETKLRASELSRASTEDQLHKAIREAAEARADSRTLKTENDRLRAELDRVNRDLADARAQLSTLQSQYSTTTVSLNDARSRMAALEREERERSEAENRRRGFADLQSALARVVTVKPVSGGFVAVLPDTFFVANRPDLALKVKPKMDALAASIADHPQISFTIEGHSDARVAADAFAMSRAQSVAAYIEAYHVPSTNYRIESRGSAVPAVAGKTVRARAANRRVEIVFAAPR